MHATRTLHPISVVTYKMQISCKPYFTRWLSRDRNTTTWRRIGVLAPFSADTEFARTSSARARARSRLKNPDSSERAEIYRDHIRRYAPAREIFIRHRTQSCRCILTRKTGKVSGTLSYTRLRQPDVNDRERGERVARGKTHAENSRLSCRFLAISSIDPSARGAKTDRRHSSDDHVVVE